MTWSAAGAVVAALAARDALATEAPSPDPSIANGDKRPLPDYDGRGPPPVAAGRVLAWIPRGIFAPLYLVSEYLVRWPLGKLTTAAEKHHVPQKIHHFFTWGPGRQSGLLPTGLIDFGLRPSVGLYFFSDDWLYRGNGLRAHVAFGGPDWYHAAASFRHYLRRQTPAHAEQQVELRGEFERRPDWRFWGIGPTTSSKQFSYFSQQLTDATLSFFGGCWHSSRIWSYAGVRDVRFYDRSSAGALTVGDAVAAGYYPAPPLFGDGYTIARAGIDGVFDSRPRRLLKSGHETDYVAPNGSGARLDLRGELAQGLRDSPPSGPGAPRRLSYARYGVTVGGFADLMNQRLLGLQLLADFVDPLVGDRAHPGQIPFTELAALGGDRPLRGFLPLRLLDRSAVAAIVEYQWPIWVWLDGVAHYAVGNVFGERLDGFGVNLLRQSFGMGFRNNASRDHVVELLIAGGTRPFSEGGKPDSFRFVLGATAGF